MFKFNRKQDDSSSHVLARLKELKAQTILEGISRNNLPAYRLLEAITVIITDAEKLEAEAK